MASLPRQKKQRRSAPDAAAAAGTAALDDALPLGAAASASSSSHAANGHHHAAAGPSHQLHYDPDQPPPLPQGALAYNPADGMPRRPYNTRVPASVREVIGGREHEVILISDGEEDDAPPAQPLSAEEAYANSYIRIPIVPGRTTRAAAALGNGKARYHPDDEQLDASAGLKAKRKAALDEDEAAYPPADGALGADAKRRRREDPATGGLPVPSGADYPPDRQYAHLGSSTSGALDTYANGAAARAPAGAAYDAGDASRQRREVAQQDYPPRPPRVAIQSLPVADKEGHFIVRKGEDVTERYKIMQQLGQGTFGKVVECWDRSKRRYVAIKIIRAVQKYRDASQIEVRVLQKLREHDPNNDNKCIHLIDMFNYRSHVCIVTELLGQSVFDFLKDNQFASFPPRHIWSFAKQLLRSVAFLHRLNLVHTDLKPENILLVDSAADVVALSKRPNARRKRVLRNSEIRLIDFGSATFDNEYHSQVVSTRHYRAPEIILQMGWSFPCDAWSIGCILVEFFTGDALFQTHDNLEHLAMMEVVLGPMPDNFRRKAESTKPDFFHGGQVNYPNKETQPHSKRYMKRMKRLQDIVNGPAAFQKHNARFLNLLQRLLAFDPAQRIKVADALNHPYFDLVDSEFPGPPCPAPGQ